MKKLLLFLLVLVTPFIVRSGQPYNNYLTTPVSQEDGDSFTTQQISVSTNTATLIDAAPTTRAGRKRTIVNMSGVYTVFIGSNTSDLATIGFQLSNSTYTNSSYTTHNSGAIYGIGQGNSAASTVKVGIIRETNSVP